MPGYIPLTSLSHAPMPSAILIEDGANICNNLRLEIDVNIFTFNNSHAVYEGLWRTNLIFCLLLFFYQWKFSQSFTIIQNRS